MNLRKQGLSALTSNTAYSNINGLELTQFGRSYAGGYSFNFVTAFQNAVDYQHKNYSNFYLTTNTTLDNFFDNTVTTVKPENLFTTLKYGDAYITFVDIDSTPYVNANRANDALNYGAIKFTSSPLSSSNFSIKFYDNNYCTVTYYKDTTEYLLVSDDNQNVFFTSNSLLNNEFNSNRPQFFNYTIDNDYNFLYLFKLYSSGNYFITKIGDSLSAVAVTPSNTPALVTSNIEIKNSTALTNELQLNTTFVTYKENTIDTDTTYTKTDIPSNYLFFKSGDLSKNYFDLINLKNIANTTDSFYSNNNLISSAQYTSRVYAEGNRNYTSIFNDIDQEEDIGLELNYIFTNQDILINSPTTYFTTGSSLSPFTSININDTKIANCGSYSSSIPYLADKIALMDNTNISLDGSTYLCTWLSGAPTSQTKIWVDRYYYPDLITKQQALTSVPTVAPIDFIESLILKNTTLNAAVLAKNFFDKKSDLVFVPNRTYRYDRVQLDNFNFLVPVNYCSLISCSAASCNNNINTSNKKIFNYFNTINDNGEFTIGFKYDGRGTDFKVYSSSNNIPGGVTFTKTHNNLAFEFKLYDSASQQYETYNTSVQNNLLAVNSVLFSFSAKTGNGIVYFSDGTEYYFNVGSLKYTGKKILFGDFFVQSNDVNQNIVIYDQLNQPLIFDVYLAFEGYNADTLLGISLSFNKQAIPDLVISVPCGMRNKTDTIRSLNSVCNNYKSKSSHVNINVKNISITNEALLSEIKSNIISNLRGYLPVNTLINNFNFINYK